MVKRGGLELAMPEAVWEHMFKEPEEPEKSRNNTSDFGRNEHCFGKGNCSPSASSV